MHMLIIIIHDNTFRHIQYTFSFFVLLSFLFVVLSISAWQNTARGEEGGTSTNGPISHWPIHGCENHTSAQMGPIRSRCHLNEGTNQRQRKRQSEVRVRTGTATLHSITTVC